VEWILNVNGNCRLSSVKSARLPSRRSIVAKHLTLFMRKKALQCVIYKYTRMCSHHKSITVEHNDTINRISFYCVWRIKKKTVA
jgi:hypothetical protein